MTWFMKHVVVTSAKFAAQAWMKWAEKKRSQKMSNKVSQLPPRESTFDHNALHDAVVRVFHEAGLTSSALYNSKQHDCDEEASLILGDLRLIARNLKDDDYTRAELIDTVEELVEDVFEPIVLYGPHRNEYRCAAERLIELMITATFKRNP